MNRVIFHQGRVCPLDKANVDTDQIIPKQFLTSVERKGFEKALFFDWRFTKDQQEDPNFVLNYPQYSGASILLTRENFGCGSSREHAPWALKQYGFEVIIAPSFADIFYTNCVNNQILLIKISPVQVDHLFNLCQTEGQLSIEIDLLNQQILIKDHPALDFDLPADVKGRLLKNQDFIGVTEELTHRITDYEQWLLQAQPWQ